MIIFRSEALVQALCIMKYVAENHTMRTIAEMSAETQELALADGFLLSDSVIEYEVSAEDLAALGFSTDSPVRFYLSTARGGFPGVHLLISCGYGHGSPNPVSFDPKKIVFYVSNSVYKK